MILPKGDKKLREIPTKQLNRVQRKRIKIIRDLPISTSIQGSNTIVLDCYIGYGVSRRFDKISEEVFEFIRAHKNVISLDAPSGLDVTTGDNIGNIRPKATLNIAFLKEGSIRAPQETIGKLYITDLSIPTRGYRSEKGINWFQAFDISYLHILEKAFQENPIQKVSIKQGPDQET